MKTILPKRKIHKTPRIVMADAYTIGSDPFQSDKAKEKSVYYITFRRELMDICPSLYKKDDNRIIFTGISYLLEYLFYDPITHEEIDEAVRFLKYAKATTKGFKRYQFNEQMWRTVVDKYNGYPPIKIDAMPEGSVVYPNEPVVVIENVDDNDMMGELAAWFESKLLQVWATSERVTQNMHLFERIKERYRSIDTSMSEDMLNYFTSLTIHDFGDRSGICPMESEVLGQVHLYTFGGTDTFSGAYQAWKNSGEAENIFSSVYALAHRNVEAYEDEKDIYIKLNDYAEDNDIISCVNDCYNSKKCTKEMLIPIAIKNRELRNGKVIVSRADSGDPKEEIQYIIEQAIENGFYEEKMINGEKWICGTTFRFMEGDGMDFATILDIIDMLIEKRYLPYSWGIFGVGGGLRNFIKRDNLSAKYALSAMGNNYDGVCKFSETLGKTTLAGKFKIRRDLESLQIQETIADINEMGENAMVNYYDGSNIYKPFGVGQDSDFLEIKDRIRNEFDTMPKTIKKYPATKKVLDKRLEILKKHAPDKDATCYV